MRNKQAIGGFGMFVVIAAAGGVGAQVPEQAFEPGKGNLRAGPVRIHPFISVGELYDDNVFLQPRDEQDDFVTVFSPGGVLQLPFRRHEFTMGYRADVLEFAQLSQEDTVRHTGRGRLTARYPGGLSWYLEDEAKRTNERPNTEFDPLIDRDQNDGRAGVEYQVADRWAVGGDYLNALYDYTNQQPLPDGTRRDFGRELDRMEQLLTADLYYLVQPKTALLVEYGYGETSYFSRSTAAARDNVIHLGRAGIRGELTAKLTSLVKLGYQIKDFDNLTRQDFGGFVVAGSLQYRPTERMRFTLSVDRSAPEASFRSQGDEFFINESLTLRAEHAFGVKVRGYIEGGFANHDYQVSERNDDYYAAAVGLRYQVQHYLGVSGEYLYEQRSSNFDFDYTNNRVFVRVSVAL